jgi:hypothetical protein
MSLGDYNLPADTIFIPQMTTTTNTTVFVPSTTTTIDTVIGGHPYIGDINGYIPNNVLPNFGPNGTWQSQGIFADPKYILNEAIKSAVKSGIDKEEIEKMINEAIASEVIES